MRTSEWGVRANVLLALGSLILIGGVVWGDDTGAPLFEQANVFVSGEDGYFAYRIPAMEATPRGTLLAFAEGRKYNLGDPGFENNDIDLVMKRSTDHGRTWSPLVLIEDAGDRWSAANPATVIDRQTGRLWLFYLRGKPGRNTHTARPGTNDIQLLARWSSDEGVSWSEPADLTEATRDFADPQWGSTVVGPGGAIQQRGGRIVLPLWRYQPYSAFAAFSDDHGATWQRGAIAEGFAGDECQLLELEDGRLLLDVRQSSGPHRWHVFSSDGGRTWSAPAPGQAVTPVCCAIERLPTPDQPRPIVWTGPKGPGRANLAVRISTDEGASFPREKLISTGPAAYSDLTILPDGTVGVLFERGVENPYQFLTFARFNRRWWEAEP